MENFNAFLIHILQYLTLAVRVKSFPEIRTEFSRIFHRNDISALAKLWSCPLERE